MSDQYIGEIRIFACNFAPRGWALCDGQLLPISQNEALFSLLGTIYGGDGRTTFGLPDLRGRIPLHQGTGPGLDEARLGGKGGSESVTLTAAAMPAHSHGGRVSTATATTDDPAGNVLATPARTTVRAYGTGTSQPLATDSSTAQGGGQAHTNIQPVQGMVMCIALQGIFPSRN